MFDIKLTKHFKLSEFVNSDTASRLAIDNTPSLDVVTNLQQLCFHVLEPMRIWFDAPILINSGYRCPALNKAVGGVPNSQHLTGEAADIHLPDKAIALKYIDFILDNCRFDQLLYEHDSQGHTWLHVSYKTCGINRQTYIPNLFKD